MKQATLLISSEKCIDDPELGFIFDILNHHLINFRISDQPNDGCIMHIKYNETINRNIYEGFMNKSMYLLVYYGSDPENFKKISMEDAGVAIAHSILQNDYRCRHCVVSTREKLEK